MRGGLLVGGLAVVVGALEAQQPGPPRFRAGVEVVPVEVSVLDARGRPVPGLTAADFTVTEDGRPQRIVAFAAMEAPGSEEAPAAGAGGDVVTNGGRPPARLVVVVMDDALVTPKMLWAARVAREVGRQVVAGLGPADLGAVVYTLDSRRAQGFTADRARLLEAVERFVPRGPGPGDLFRLYALATLRQVVETLAAVPDRRRVVVFVSPGVAMRVAERAAPVAFNVPGDPQGQAGTLRRELGAIVQQAREAHVPIYAVSVNGLCPDASCDPQHDFLRTLAHETGGFAVVDTNDVAPGVAEILPANASYYVLGYEPAVRRGDGRWHRIAVRVGRPGVTVRARQGYEDRRVPAVPPLDAALAGVVPATDLPLAAWADAFVGADGRPGALVVVGLPEAEAEGKGGAPAAVEVRVVASDERLRVARTGRVRVGGKTALLGGDVPVWLPLPAGRYQVRVAAGRGERGPAGSVFLDVEVPAWAREPVGLSGVAVGGGAAEGPRAVRVGGVPFVPTTRRVFRREERVQGFVQVVRRERGGASAVTVVMRVVSERGDTVVEARETVGEQAFGRGRVVGRGLEVPGGTLRPGSYRLVVQAVPVRGAAVERRVAFTVR
jgi:VWFA-related protein